MPKPYRSKSKLALDVLRAVRDEGTAHTNRVLLLANLSYARLQEQLRGLEAKGWVETVDGPQRAWRLTEAGRRVLASLEQVEALMGDFGLPL